MSFIATIVHAADKPAATQGFTIFGLDPLTVVLVLVLAVFVIFMVRSSRRRKREAEELQNKFVPGAEVMTQHGIFGTLLSIDEDKNEVIVETTPGTRLRIHRSMVTRVIEPQDIDPSEDIVADESDADAAPEGKPEYGVRLNETDAIPNAVEEPPARKPRTPRAKPTNGE